MTNNLFNFLCAVQVFGIQIISWKSNVAIRLDFSRFNLISISQNIKILMKRELISNMMIGNDILY